GFRYRDFLLGDGPAQFELQQPSLIAMVGDAPELQCADLGQSCPQVHRNAARPLTGSFEQRVNGWQRTHVITHRHDFARPLNAIGSGRKERKPYRTPKREIEDALSEFDGLSFFMAPRHYTKNKGTLAS